MKKESPVGLFFSMFLKAIVVILGLVIVVFGILIVTNVVKGNNKDNKNPATTVGENVLTEAEQKDDLLSNETTAAPYKDTSKPEEGGMDKSEMKVMVLNSTDISGLAGRWAEKLEGYGYMQADASDYSVTLETTKIYAVKDGVGKELLQYFKNAEYEVGTVTENISESMDGYDVVIILGSADDDGQGGDSDESYEESYDSDESYQESNDESYSE